MNGKFAKKLRRLSEEETVGQNAATTRTYYRDLKRIFQQMNRYQQGGPYVGKIVDKPLIKNDPSSSRNVMMRARHNRALIRIGRHLRRK